MAFIFETEYRWSAQDAGTIVSCTFLSCIPFRWLWQCLTSTELSRIVFTGRSLIVASLLALVLHPTCHQTLLKVLPNFLSFFSVHVPWSFLALADIGMFPLIYLATGMCISFSVRLASRDNSGTMDLTYISKLQSVVSNIGKCLGPPASRVVLEASGRAWYSISLFVCLSAVVVVYQRLIWPSLQKVLEMNESSATLEPQKASSAEHGEKRSVGEPRETTSGQSE
jgi:hypothetical protein